MAYVTWAVGANGTATVYCHHCRKIFSLNIKSSDARCMSEQESKNHHCTPPMPWRVQTNGAQS